MVITIDKKLLPMKAYYFLFNAGTAPIIPFMPTLAKQLGFSTVAVGTIYTILPIIGMFVKPIFGAIADKFRIQKLLFIIFQIVTGISLFCIIFIPPVFNPTVEFHCNDGESSMKLCPAIMKSKLCTNECIEYCQLDCKLSESWMWNVVCNNWNVSLDCNKPKSNIEFTALLRMDQTLEYNDGCSFTLVHRGIVNDKNSSLYCPVKQEFFKTECSINCNDTNLSNSYKIESAITKYQFWIFFLLMIIGWKSMAIVVSIGDAICFEMLNNRPHLYGNQRLWGAIGWGIFSLLAGILVDQFSSKDSTDKNYTVIFYMGLIILLFGAFISNKLQFEQTEIKTNILKDIRKVFQSVQILIFFIWCTAIGMCTALIWNFLLWHLEEIAKTNNDHNWMKTLQGLVMGIQCFAGELPFFFLSGWILKKIGHIHAMSLILFGFGIRFVLYSVITNPWWVLPIETLNGITFGLFYATMASYASIVAAPGTEATLQGLVGAVFEGIGVSLGSLIGGILFKVIGSSHTFLLFGLCSLFLFVLHTVVQHILKKYNKKSGIQPEYLAPRDALYRLQDDDQNTLS